jgi:hypothetical protein
MILFYNVLDLWLLAPVLEWLGEIRASAKKPK